MQLTFGNSAIVTLATSFLIFLVFASNGSLALWAFRYPHLRQVYYPFICELAVNAVLYLLYFVDYVLYAYFAQSWMGKGGSLLCEVFSFLNTFLVFFEAQLVMALTIYCILEKHKRIRRVALAGILLFAVVVFRIGYFEEERKMTGCFHHNEFVMFLFESGLDGTIILNAFVIIIAIFWMRPEGTSFSQLDKQKYFSWIKFFIPPEG
ncbi:hypothetical protein PFISCL1PPCAC_12878, partial [Pristionchus fissidentatus]